jgi:zinc protease
LVDSELAVSAGSSFRASIDPDLFSFYATLAPEVSHEQIEEVIWRELEKVQREGVQPAELEKAIKQTKAQFAYSSESVTHQGFWLGFSQVVASLAWLDRWLEELSLVSIEDVQRVAQCYFRPNRQTVGWYIPE